MNIKVELDFMKVFIKRHENRYSNSSGIANEPCVILLKF